MTDTAATEAARALAARRPRTTYVCAVCGREFEAIQRTDENSERTCGQACRSKLYLQRRKAQQQP